MAIVINGSGTVTGLSVGGLPDGSVDAGTVASDVATQAELDALDLTSIRRDIGALALHSAVADNKAAYNLPNSFIDQFEDDTGIGTETDVDRNASEFVSTADAAGGNDSYTKLLISSDTSNGSTTFTDSSPSARTVTAANGAAHSTTQAKFGSSSIYINGDDNLRAAHSADLDFDGQFTIDFWAWRSAYGPTMNNRLFQKGPNHSDGYGLFNNNSHLIYFGRTDENLASWTQDLRDSSWHHYAITRQSDNKFRIYLDGTLKATSASAYSDNLNYTGDLYIASYPGDPTSSRYSGYIDEFRVSKGIARYTSNFTPATTVYGGTSATGTLISTAQTASSAQTKVSGVILYKNNAGTATLGTDLKVYFTCNGGTNWTESTPAAAGTFSTGILMAKCPEVTCTSGTDVRYKVVWANQAAGSKETQLHGIAMNY